jgi:hypothetical protein
MAQASGRTDATLVALTPSIEVIRWHHAREEFVGQELHGKTPEVKGAIIGEPGRRTWCYWTRMWYNEDHASQDGNTLYILRFVAEGCGSVDWEMDGLSGESLNARAEDVAALLRLAQVEACRWGLDRVDIWNPNAASEKAAKMVSRSAAIVDREEESICSLRWHGDEAESVVWLANEKYGWC